MKRNKEIVSLPCNYDIRHFLILLNIRSLTILDISIPIPITHACTRTSVKAYVTQAETSSDLIRQGFHSFKHLLIFQNMNDDYFPTSYPSHLSVPSSFIQFLSSSLPHLCHPCLLTIISLLLPFLHSPHFSLPWQLREGPQSSDNVWQHWPRSPIFSFSSEYWDKTPHIQVPVWQLRRKKRAQFLPRVYLLLAPQG